MDKIFDALASSVRRKILIHLSKSPLTAGEISKKFDISKPSLSKHLSILQNAGLVSSKKKGQFITYNLTTDKLINTLHNFLSEVTLEPQVKKPAKKPEAQADNIVKIPIREETVTEVSAQDSHEIKNSVTKIENPIELFATEKKSKKKKNSENLSLF